MRAPPFRRDRAMASAAASASTSGIGSGSLTYGRDGSETVHRRHRPSRHHDRRAWSNSVVSRSSGYGGVIRSDAWRIRTSTCLDPQAEQRNPPHTSGNGVSAA
jgi:hypothetical protein